MLKEFEPTTKIDRYLSWDSTIMHGAFDSEGYYKTGDIGRIKNGLLFVLGRASYDGTFCLA